MEPSHTGTRGPRRETGFDALSARDDRASDRHSPVGHGGLLADGTGTAGGSPPSTGEDGAPGGTERDTGGH